MGGYDFMWNAIQSGRIAQLEEEVRELKDVVGRLSLWMIYFMEKENGSQKEGNPHSSTSMVEAPTGLETGILEVRASGSKESDEK